MKLSFNVIELDSGFHVTVTPIQEAAMWAGIAPPPPQPATPLAKTTQHALTNATEVFAFMRNKLESETN